MRKLVLVCALALACVLVTGRATFSHCEIPCGIYGDQTRITLLLEDIATVEKSMQQIELLSDADPINPNQVVRWIQNKEEHASKIQHVVTQYWLTQRIQPVEASSAEAHKKYLGQLEILHHMLVRAMKAKQTTDTTHTTTLRSLVDKLAESYFSAEDLKHLRESHEHAK